MNRFPSSEVLFHCQSHKVSFERYLPTCLIIKLSPELSISWVVKSHSRSHRLLLYVNGKANKILLLFAIQSETTNFLTLLKNRSV